MKKFLPLSLLLVFISVGFVNASEVENLLQFDSKSEILQGLSSINAEIVNKAYDSDGVEVTFKINEPFVYRGSLTAGFETFVEMIDGGSQLIDQDYQSLSNIREEDGTYKATYRLPNRIIESQSEAEIWFYIRTENGLSLFAENIVDGDSVLMPLPSAGLMIRTCQFLPKNDQEFFDLGHIGVIESGQSMDISCRLINRSSNSVEIIPNIEIRERYSGGKVVSGGLGYGQMVLEAGEITDLLLPVPSIDDPGLYNIEFSVRSNDDIYYQSSYIKDVVVRGVDATILSSIFYAKGDLISGHVLWSGRSDNLIPNERISTLETPILNIAFFNQLGEMCGDELNRSARDEVVSVEAGDFGKCDPVSIDVTLLNNRGEVLDYQNIRLGVVEEKGSDMLWFISVIVLLILVAIIAFVSRKMNDGNNDGLKSKIAGLNLVVFAILLVFGFNLTTLNVEANSHTGPVLYVEKNGNGTGLVSSTPTGINCGSDCNETYSPGQSITLTASPSAGMQFDGWGGDAASCGSNTTCVVTMGTEPGNSGDDVYGGLTSATASTVDSCDGNRNVSYLCAESDDFSCVDVVAIGNFCAKTCVPSISGELCVSCPAQVAPNCMPNSCLTNYQKRDVECNPATQADYDRNVIATFSQAPVTEYTISVNKNGTGTGTVESDDLSINCGSLCTNNYPEGDNQTLMAIPDPNTGSTFVSWTNCPNPVGQICNVTNISQDYSITATFNTEATPNEYLLTSAVTGPGSVSSNPPGISCPIDCNELYTGGVSVTLTATKDNPEDSFDGWGGDASGCGLNATCVIFMNADKDVTATFTAGAGAFFTVTTSVVNPHSEGNTKRAVRVYEDSDGNGTYEFLKTCYVNDCLQDIEEGLPVRLTRFLCTSLCNDPDTTEDFLGWIGPNANLCASQSAASCLFTMPSNSVTIRAEFTPQGEVCGDGIDNDGDGQIDEGCSLSVSCTVSPARAFIGENVTWTANVFGGNGVYTYRWFGSGNLENRTGAVEVVSYQSVGNKWGQVEVTSGAEEPVLSEPCTNSDNGTGVDIQYKLTTNIYPKPGFSNRGVNGRIVDTQSGVDCGAIDPNNSCISGHDEDSEIDLTFSEGQATVFIRWVDASGNRADGICSNALSDTCSFTISSDTIVKAEVRNTECWDGLDNDDDTEVDYHNSPNQGDPQCTDRNDDDESGNDEPQAPQCSDGIDNEDTEDTLADIADPGCHTDGDPDSNGDGEPDNLDGSYDPNKTSEDDFPTFKCDDGIDNDEDGTCDFAGCTIDGVFKPADPSCGGNPFSDGEGRADVIDEI